AHISIQVPLSISARLNALPFFTLTKVRGLLSVHRNSRLGFSDKSNSVRLLKEQLRSCRAVSAASSSTLRLFWSHFKLVRFIKASIPVRLFIPALITSSA